MGEKQAVNKTTTAEESYRTYFIPNVHRIGRLTMIMEIILSLLPVAYIVFVRGQAMNWYSYLTTFLGTAPIMMTMWISEPLAYWPVLGSAGTYIGYFSGNVSTMRFPVAVTVQREMKADINTPRGQVATIVGIVASVIVALIILLAIVLGGEVILSILPEAVTESFSFIMVAMIGAMVVMNISGQFAKRPDGSRPVKEGLINLISYMGTGVVVTVIINLFIPALASVSMLLCIICALIVAYIRYRYDLKKAAQAG